MLFVLVNLARFVKVDPEQALRRTNAKFRQRFGYIERKLAEQRQDAGGVEHRGNGGAVAGSEADDRDPAVVLSSTSSPKCCGCRRSSGDSPTSNCCRCASWWWSARWAATSSARTTAREMVGFCFAIPGVKTGGRPTCTATCWACCREYHNAGIGRRLKLGSAKRRSSRGITLIEWTFDPLELKNAFFNIERLGAIVRRYSENQYGVTASPLHGGLPTDRCIAEWWLDSPRVRRVLDGRAAGARRRGADRLSRPISRASAPRTRTARARSSAPTRDKFQRGVRTRAGRHRLRAHANRRARTCWSHDE